jgi:phosphohistidine phosphatase
MLSLEPMSGVFTCLALVLAASGRYIEEMKRLMLLRHAKSDWPAGFSDHERPLAMRGLMAAPLMGRYMAGEYLIPDIALVSSARRTRETWDGLSTDWAQPVPMRIETALYAAPCETVFELVRALPATTNLALIIGHNPSMEECARLMTGHGDRYAFARLTRKYPTAGLTVLDFSIAAWNDIDKAGARLDRFVTPAMLDGLEDE